MQLNAVNDMLQNRAIGRKLSVKIFDYQNIENASDECKTNYQTKRRYQY